LRDWAKESRYFRFFRRYTSFSSTRLRCMPLDPNREMALVAIHKESAEPIRMAELA
jgi:hypothetical protein